VEEADGVGIRQAGAGPLDQLVAGLDGGDPQRARDQAASQLAGAAADLENVVAAAQAGQLAGTLDQLLGVGGPAALILGGNAVEDGAVAALGGGLGHHRTLRASSLELHPWCNDSGNRAVVCVDMPLTSRGRRRKALAQPFPDTWRALLMEHMAHWRMLDTRERERAETLIRLLLADKLWEASSGFALTEEIRVLVSAMASMLILELDYDYYHRVTSIVVSPSTTHMPGEHYVGNGVFSDAPMAFVGLSAHSGPVVIAWDAARVEALHPDEGKNVVYHEFAHKLDAEDGSSNGAPPFETETEFRSWVAVATPEYERLRHGHVDAVLDPYGATNPAEFFAVATEAFFNRPLLLEAQSPELYAGLRRFYNQHPAARERRALKAGGEFQRPNQ
jgi:Mlc titration factor MtfA (ptsG expression regulator)